MKQTEATEQVALALVGGGIFDDVSLLTPIKVDGRAGAPVILTDCLGTRLSVTVEVLTP